MLHRACDWGAGPAEIDEERVSAILHSFTQAIVSYQEGGPMKTSNCASVVALLAVTILLSIPVGVNAAWPPNGTAVCTATNDQEHQVMASDDAGGAIISWQDYRSGNYDIYAQRVSATGTILWTTNGAPLCTATGAQGDWPEIAADGAGGAIVVWGDWRGGIDEDIYAQRVNSSGAVQWTTNGVALCSAAGNQRNPAIAATVSGGAIFVWQDSRSGTNDIFAQRVDASGAPLWTAYGESICTAIGEQVNPAIVLDGSGGAVIVWQDGRGGDFDIYAQRVGISGAVQWTTNGVAVCSATNDQQLPALLRNAADDFIIGWVDKRSGTGDIYGQKINSSGADQWTAGGLPLCSATGDQGNLKMTASGAGGAAFVWQDARSGTADIYAQRIDAAGAKLWGLDGVAVCTATGGQRNPALTTDGDRGAIAVWRDERTGDYDIYAQRVDASGTTQWSTDGEGVIVMGGWQDDWPKIVTDQDGGGIAAWGDMRGDTDEDTYAQRITSEGNMGSDPVPVSTIAVCCIALAIGALGLRRLMRTRATNA
jgi:hypothetical protein